MSDATSLQIFGKLGCRDPDNDFDLAVAVVRLADLPPWRQCGVCGIQVGGFVVE